MRKSSRWSGAVLGLLLAVLGATPGEARDSSLAAATVTITASQLSPSDLRLTASLAGPSWVNADTVAHTVTFSNGLCTVTVEPAQRNGCSYAFWRFVGVYPYSVDGVEQGAGRLIVVPARRTVTIRASRSVITRGKEVVLAGKLFYETALPFVSGQPVTVLGRVNGTKRFVKVAVARSTLPTSNNFRIGTFNWRVVLGPKTTTTYRAVDFVQPPGGRVWQRAISATITVHVRP